MFEQMFDEYRKAVDSSFKVQQDMCRQLLNGWSVKPADVTKALDRGAINDQIHGFQRKWSHTLVEIMEKNREVFNQQYKSGIDAIASAFHLTKARYARAILAIDPRILAEKHLHLQDGT